MALFDELIADIAARFDLGEKAGPLLRQLAGLIQDHPDGIGGFLNQFKNAGFGQQAASWLGDGKAAALSGPQVEQALGAGVVAAIGGKLGLTAGATGDAIGYALPKLVGLLTPGGTIPKALPASLTGFLSAAPPRLPAALAKPAAYAPREPRPKSSAGLWPVPLLLLIGVAALTYYYPRLYNEYYPLYKDQYPILALVLPPATLAPEAPKAEASAPAAAPAPAGAPSPVAAAPKSAPAAAPPAAAPPVAPAPAPTVPAQLNLTKANGVVTYAGSVDSAASHDEIVDLLKMQFGAEHIKGDISVDPKIAAPVWLASLKSALEFFKTPSWHVAFDGAALEVGAATGADKIVAGLKTLYGDAVAVSGPAKAKGAQEAADEQTSAALAALKPGFSGADLVAILNKYVINFDTGSATISDASKPILQQAAGLIKQLPHDAKVHIDGYTDATGDPAANILLSRHRAEAVRDLLIDAGVPATELRARGHGAAHTGEGENRSDRRIEFSVK